MPPMLCPDPRGQLVAGHRTELRHECVICSGEGRSALDVDDTAQARDGFGQPERLRPAKAVADDHGALELVVDDVTHQLLMYSCK